MDEPATNDAKTSPPTVFATRRMIAGFLLIAVIIAVAAIVLATSNTVASAVVSPQDCGGKVLSYLNANAVTSGTSAGLGSVTEKSGVYLITVRYQGRSIPVYTTKDCTLLFLNSIQLAGNPSTAAQPQPPAEPVKSASPVVDLYVMAFCPYGTQAESAMQPVVNLLGGKANISVRYIATIQGTNAASVSSLHGPSEAMEDLRQICVKRDYPQQFWPYVGAFDENCYPDVQNQTLLDTCRASTMQSLGIDVQAIETCARSADVLALLKADEALTNAYSVQASPTLIINGQVYNGDRTPEAYKEAICSSFTTPPAECSVTLSTQSATASSGGCG
jgi:hypothetical protein